MEVESKSAPVTGDHYVAHTDGPIANEQPVTELFEDSRIKSLRLINALSYALTALIVLASLHTSIDDEYDDYESWSANQTLLSAAPYTQYIWYLLLILQGLFIAASFLPSLWSSELLGYSALATQSGELAYKNQLPVVHYSALCASTLLMMYSAKLYYMGLAFVGSCASTYFLISIIKYQLDNDVAQTDEDTLNDIKRFFQQRRTQASTLQLNDESTEVASDKNKLKHLTQQYLFLKLPFELYAGFNLALNVALLNVIINKLIGSAVFNIVLASMSLVLLLGVGCYVTWKEKKGLCYGIGGGLAWYMFGVFFQLIYPSATISMTYSEGAITATKYIAIIFANILLSTVILRAVKNVINVNVLSSEEVEDEHEQQEDEEDVNAGYIQAEVA